MIYDANTVMLWLWPIMDLMNLDSAQYIA